MNLNISHKTIYTFDNQVFLEPHHFYFYPAPRSYYNIENFAIRVDPDYQGLASRIDAENNIYYQCWFQNSVQLLEINVDISLKISNYNPFNFLIEENKAADLTPLAVYLYKEPVSPDLLKWTEQFELNKQELINFLLAICSTIHSEFTHTIRYESTLLTPDECYQNKSGSCRDLSWLMIQILRYNDVPARFVGGYSFNPELEEGHELHAWVEAWVPGAGWIGADPSIGMLTTSTYIPIAASHLPENTSPVQGTFRGSAHSDISYEVEIEVS